MSEQILVGCSGWNYGGTPDKGGWTGVFYPDKDLNSNLKENQFDYIFDKGSFHVLLPTDRQIHHQAWMMKN